MSGLFITSSGTEIGKTFVTCALMYQCRVHYRSVMALKPIISGIEDGWDESDTAMIAEAMGRKPSRDVLQTISPFSFQKPLSPAMAAQAEGTTLDYESVLAVCRDSLTHFPLTVIEGVGGAFVPLTERILVADWIKDLGLPSLVVVGSYLGAQSHALATIEAMQARSLPIAGLVVSESQGEHHPDFDETVETLRRLSQLKTVGIKRQKNSRSYQALPSLMDFLPDE